MVPATPRDTGPRRRCCCCCCRWPAAERCATTPRDDRRCARDQGADTNWSQAAAAGARAPGPRRSGFADAQVAGGPTHEAETKVSCLLRAHLHGGHGGRSLSGRSVATDVRHADETHLRCDGRSCGTERRCGVHLLRQDGWNKPWPSKRNPQRVPKPRRDRRKPHHCLLSPAGASRRNRALAATGAARALRIRNPEVLVPESLEDSGSPPYGVLGRRRGVEVLTVGLGRPRQRRAGPPGRFALPFTQRLSTEAQKSTAFRVFLMDGGDTIADVLLSLKHAVVHPSSPAGGAGPYGAGPAEAPPPPPPPHMFPTSMSVNLSMNMTMGVTGWEPSYAAQWAPPPYHHHPQEELYASTGYATDVAAPPPPPPPAPHQVAAGQVAGGVVAQGGIAGVPGAARGSDGRVNLCGICGKAYARPSTLKTHLRTHSGERPYRCLQCSKCFSQAANLTAHLRTHSGEKPFRCPVGRYRGGHSLRLRVGRVALSGGIRPGATTWCRLGGPLYLNQVPGQVRSDTQREGLGCLARHLHRVVVVVSEMEQSLLELSVHRPVSIGCRSSVRVATRSRDRSPRDHSSSSFVSSRDVASDSCLEHLTEAVPPLLSRTVIRAACRYHSSCSGILLFTWFAVQCSSKLSTEAQQSTAFRVLLMDGGDTIADVLLSLKDAVVHPNSPAGGVGAYGAGPAEAPPPPPPPHMFPTSMSVNLSMNMTMGVTSWEPSYATHWAPPPYHHHHPSTGYAKDVAAPPPLPPPAPHQVAAGQVAGGVVAQGGIAGVPGAARGSDGRVNLCGICGKAYARPSTLKMHLRTHSGERPYRCLQCSKCFSQAANLTAHLRTHSGEKPFRCPVCERRFSQSSSVTTHMRTHSGERPYRCFLCKKAFSDSSTLTKHMRTHSGEKPYQCRLCLLRFSQSGNLNRHMRVHANVS
ncbi:hypothetical protein HPB49_020642 [Dermacentor silvarum]|uniref:Uncharacterized protein n=1 Tax=Dermacentor silvarum TaxID=543639 RepID=A0ACB8E303_DERSI|nr:hypothetical protein HPB49_020642 [Dermacentor silvarum]